MFLLNQGLLNWKSLYLLTIITFKVYMSTFLNSCIIIFIFVESTKPGTNCDLKLPHTLLLNELRNTAQPVELHLSWLTVPVNGIQSIGCTLDSVHFTLWIAGTSLKLLLIKKQQASKQPATTPLPSLLYFRTFCTAEKGRYRWKVPDLNFEY